MFHCDTLTKIAKLEKVTRVSTDYQGNMVTELTGAQAVADIIGWLYRKYVYGAEITTWFKNDPELGRVLVKVKDRSNGYIDRYEYE